MNTCIWILVKWSALNMGFVVKRPSRMKEQCFFRFRAGRAAIFGRVWKKSGRGQKFRGRVALTRIWNPYYFVGRYLTSSHSYIFFLLFFLPNPILFLHVFPQCYYSMCWQQPLHIIIMFVGPWRTFPNHFISWSLETKILFLKKNDLF